MLFSVIIPAYNRASLLAGTIESVLSQTLADYEIIVVDDGSTDETLDVIARYHGRIRFFRQQNKGPGAARNLGIEKAAGEYIAFLDSDDCWCPWALQVVQNNLRAHGSPSILVMKVLDFAHESEMAQIKEQPPRSQVFPDYIAAAQRDDFTVLTCSSVVIRTALLRQAGGFSSKNVNAEDSDLWLRLGEALGFVEIESPICCGYRRHHGSAVSNLRKTHSGLIDLVMNEARGVYPGGRARARERRKIVTRHVRPASLALAKSGALPQAVELYKKTLGWNALSLRFRYLLGFWFYTLSRQTPNPEHWK